MIDKAIALIEKGKSLDILLCTNENLFSFKTVIYKIIKNIY